MTAFRTDLSAEAAERWGAERAAALTSLLSSIHDALGVLADLPSSEPRSLPPLTGRPAAPRFAVRPARAGDDLARAGAGQLAAGIAAGEVSPVAIVEALVPRAAALEPRLATWVLLDAAGARQAAAEREHEARAGTIRGPLHGVPVGIKDIIDVAGLPTRANSAIRRTAPPATADAPGVAHLRAAGAIVLGKTATTTFAYADPSAARNPWNPDHTPGGSSSGSAAGVAARLVPGALGTQTGGSVLRPAAFCGIVGFKPSYGRVSREGVLPLAWSLDHVGTLTRSVADAALLYAVMAGAEGEPAESRPPRLGFAGDFHAASTDETSRAALQAAAATLADAGASVSPLDLDWLGEPAGAAHEVIMACEVSAYHLGVHADRLAELEPRLRNLTEAGALIPAQALLRAWGVRGRLRDEAAAALAPYDAVIVPAAPGAAPVGLGSTGDPALNSPWSLLGVPAIALPITVTAEGMPLAMQLVAPYGEDARLLEVAAWCEAALDFSAQPPRVASL